ncbi:Legionella vir region protein [Legionella nautarum]|uniref:Legionella vir region protein n=1 Tax=Legionella nautarum TaxID=45070 RepID=A0A0W0WIQ0_9GAMM|nr:hypothetical protein [Legionella nautarum]KTD32205.1 Legionella vir region protein [Legionella nautarum]
MTQIKVFTLLLPKFGKKQGFKKNSNQIVSKKRNKRGSKLKHLAFFALLYFPMFSANANSNFASVQFVVDVANALRKEFNVGFQAMQTQVNNVFNQLSTNVSAQITSINQELKRDLEPLKEQINNLPIRSHHIGDRIEGGVVFFVDASLQHGLVASLDDVHEGIEWRNGESGDRLINAAGLGVGAGETNTRLIIAQQTVDQQDGQYAALLAANYQVTAQGASCSALSNHELCYGGWFLPSLQELSLLLTNLKQTPVGHRPEGTYWSSTEGNFTQSWALDSNQAEPLLLDKAVLGKIRAIRKF